MQKIKNWLFTLMILGLAVPQLYAYIPSGLHGKPSENSLAPTASYREDCAVSKSQIDLDINNVRARLHVVAIFGGILKMVCTLYQTFQQV